MVAMCAFDAKAILLRNVVESDLPVLFEHQRDPDACRMAAFASRDRDAFMVHWLNILADKAVITKAVVVHGELAGNVVSFDRADQRLLGYWIGREFWGRGIASAAVAQFLKIETSRPLHARVACHNRGSIRVLKKCGFKELATEDFVDPAGESISEHLMVLV